ncbi:hypothetical protein JRF84_33990 [Methylobacterium organophilum]|jgi:hypothetical protein|uniref:hypothetical protein n=1 Tax=Methylobacterium organophilum TaxID=410 RepID=UPI0019D0C62E|nr:hypothetical protein [Methylobacterium organophilum]MBN6824576.1 hypothetical protein [Methylobacterium organophilum]
MENALKDNPVAYAAVLAVVRSAWALIDNTGYHEFLPLAINRDDWDELAADLKALEMLIPYEERPAEPPHAIVCLWPNKQAAENTGGQTSADYQDGFNTANDRADERIREFEAEIERLCIELAMAQGTIRGLEDWIKGYRIRGRKPLWVKLYGQACNRPIED